MNDCDFYLSSSLTSHRCSVLTGTYTVLPHSHTCFFYIPQQTHTDGCIGGNSLSILPNESVTLRRSGW